jgi:hypothetical protein
VCAGLLLLFAGLAWSAVSEKSPTMDEPYHALAGWLHLWRGDFRFDSEDPPLWNTLAAAAAGPHAIRADLRMKGLNWSLLPMDALDEGIFEIQTLFRTPGNDATAFMAKFRAVMLCYGVGLGGMLAAFVWRLARSAGARPAAAGVATVFATALFSFDPNFLAHTVLVKNDVASALVLLGLTAATWAAGRALVPGRVLVLGIWSAAAVTVKFNGPLLIAISAALLVLRALVLGPWRVGARAATAAMRVSAAQRVAAVLATVAVMGAFSFAAIWLSYGLRFAPAADAGAKMDIGRAVLACLIRDWQATHVHGDESITPPDRALMEMPWPMTVQFAIWAEHHHVLPEAFIGGLLFFYQSALLRPTFLWGRISELGTWWYFPFAMAVKTPLATLAAFAGAAIIGVRTLARRHADRAKGDAANVRIEAPANVWTSLCLGLPVLVYLAAMMSSNLNLGVRHVLPVYPLLFAAAGLAMAALWSYRPAAASVAGMVLISGLAVESCWAYPNYIPFFNIVAGGSRGGLGLLSDSNLDWGQDLPLLAKWQRDHPNEYLYLAYFGSSDPAYYGIRYTNLKMGYTAGPPMQPLSRPGVIAISATTLQGAWNGQYWSMLWKQKPFEVLGGSIYLFHFPPSPADQLPAGERLVD